MVDASMLFALFDRMVTGIMTDAQRERCADDDLNGRRRIPAGHAHPVDRAATRSAEVLPL